MTMMHAAPSTSRRRRRRRRRTYTTFRDSLQASWILTTLLSCATIVFGFSSPSSTTSTTTATTTTSSSNTAVILNTNARSVTPSLAPICQEIFGSENVFLTTTSDEGRQAAESIILQQQRGYKLVVPVGGDGTLAQTINDMCDAYLAKHETKSLSQAIEDLPLFGYLPMGTGNGVGSSVGCRLKNGLLLRRQSREDNIRQVLQKLQLVGDRIKDRDDESRYNIVELPMIEVCKEEEEEEDYENSNSTEKKKKKGDLCFFAGVGFDSLMLDDFKQVKAWSIRTGFLPRILGSVVGYCVALVTRTLPKALTRGEHRIHVQLSTNDMDMLWVDHRRGDFVQPIARNIKKQDDRRRPKQEEMKEEEPVVIFSGTTGICCAGTSPFYGGGLRLFPFARMTLDKMHLRLGRISPMVGFVNIPQIFAGSYREPSESRFGCIDFIGKEFDVEVKRKQRQQQQSNNTTGEGGGNNKKGFPFQHSGESKGNFERFRLRVTDGKIRFVNFMEQRCISCED